MAISGRDLIQMLRDENELLKTRNKLVSNKLARQQQAFRVLARMIDKTRQMSASQALPDLLNDLLADVMHVCNIENGSLLLIDEAAQQLEFVAVIGDSHEHLLNHRIDIRTGLVGEVIRTRNPVLVADVHASPQWSSLIDQSLNFHTASLMCVPVTIRDEVIGAIEVVTQTGDTPFEDHDLNILRVTGRLVSQALECIDEQLRNSGDPHA